MRKLFIPVIIPLLLVFSACALRKEPAEVSASGKDFDYYLNQGSLSLTEGNPDKAIIQLKEAVALNPDSPKAHNLLGIAYFQKKDYRLVSSHYGLGTLLAAQGRVEESSHYFSKGIELDPEFLDRNPAFVATFTSDALRNPEVLFTYAKIYAVAGNVEKAVLYLQRAEEAGFKDWYRIGKEKEFEKVREDERIKDFIR